MSPFYYIVVACWAVLIIYWIVSAFFVKRDVGTSSWRAFLYIRVILLGLVIGVAASTHRDVWMLKFFTWVQHDSSVAALGAALCVTGTAFALWARFTLGSDWSPAPALKEGHTLVTSGPYALVRHPIYTGFILAMLGTTLIVPAWIIVLVGMGAVFVWRVHVEDRLMLTQFPTQFPAYRARTWKLVPWVW